MPKGPEGQKRPAHRFADLPHMAHDGCHRCIEFNPARGLGGR